MNAQKLHLVTYEKLVLFLLSEALCRSAIGIAAHQLRSTGLEKGLRIRFNVYCDINNCYII